MTDLSSQADAELRRLGATDEEITSARAADAIDLLAVAHAAVPGPPKYTAAEVAATTHIDRDVARRFWRALGFPDVPDDEVVFTDADVEAIETVGTILTSGMADVEEAVQLTRVIGSSMNRIAEAMVSGSTPSGPRLAADAELVVFAAEDALRTQSSLLDYVWRRHLAATVRRQLLGRLHPDLSSSSIAVGFADLVGFTAMSQQLEQAELAKVVARFEDLAFEQITSHAGRVAKMIGDEVMFAVRDVADAVETGLALAEAYADDELLSDVRVGLACGEVLTYEGDYFGPVVNVASRIVNIAVPGSVVVSPEVRDALEGDDRFAFHPLRPRHLKDIGRIRLWRVRRPS